MSKTQHGPLFLQLLIQLVSRIPQGSFGVPAQLAVLAQLTQNFTSAAVQPRPVALHYSVIVSKTITKPVALPVYFVIT